MKKVVAIAVASLPLSFFYLFPYLLHLLKEYLVNKELDDDEDNFMKVAIVEDKAYWIVNNTFWEADVVDEEIIKEEARQVDAFDLDFKDVNKMMIILDSIEDWKN
jgi:hypothetical protein